MVYYLSEKLWLSAKFKNKKQIRAKYKKIMKKDKKSQHTDFSSQPLQYIQKDFQKFMSKQKKKTFTEKITKYQKQGPFTKSLTSMLN